MRISDFLRIPYVPHGRDANGCDCWGLVRLVRQALRGDDLAAHATVDPDDKPAMTAATHDVLSGGFEQVGPQAGAIACVWRADFCIHVGIVLEAERRLVVLETTPHGGPRWLRIEDFETRYRRVTYHDRDL
ncbi:hypothetical protein ACLIIZ_03035 [Azonexus caeni]|uniref:hypothetical protein n=1 Tax=Azonexus caeni TaxID=266126 RepID=UPI003A881DC7